MQIAGTPFFTLPANRCHYFINQLSVSLSLQIPHYCFHDLAFVLSALLRPFSKYLPVPHYPEKSHTVLLEKYFLFPVSIQVHLAVSAP